MRLLRTLAPLALVAGLATACGNGSSSEPGTSNGATVSGSLELRPVAARYAQDTSEGQEQLGPQTPKQLVDTMKSYDCTSQPAVVQGDLMECDAARNVFLMHAPLVAGDVASATAKKIGGGSEWYVQVVYDDKGSAALSQAADSMAGQELAVVLGDRVLTAIVVNPGLKNGHVGITGDLDQKTATALAGQITAG